MKRVLFVDSDTAALQLLSDELGRSKPVWECEFLTDGQTALAQIRSKSFDAVICGVSLGSMSGEDLLGKARERRPMAVRVLMTARFDRASMLQMLGVAHRVVPKPVSWDGLSGFLTRAFALRDLLDDDNLRRLISQTHALPSLPPLYIELLEALRDVEVSVSRVSQIVSRDLGMCTKILQVVNSAYFGIPHTIYRIEEGITYLGMEMVRVLVLSLQIFSLFEKERVREFSFETLWKHSWRVGMLSRKIATSEGLDEATIDQAFLSGLLHDVGKLLLVTNLAKLYHGVQVELQKIMLPDWEAEKKILHCTHAEVGAYLMGLWGLPDPVVETVAWHHRPSEKPTNSLDATAIIHFANAIDHARKLPQAIINLGWLDRGLLERLQLVDQYARWQELAAEG